MKPAFEKDYDNSEPFEDITIKYLHAEYKETHSSLMTPRYYTYEFSIKKDNPYAN